MVTVVAEGKHAISRVIDTYIAKQNKELLQLLKNLRKDKVAVRDPSGWLNRSACCVGLHRLVACRKPPTLFRQPRMRR